MASSGSLTLMYATLSWELYNDNMITYTWRISSAKHYCGYRIVINEDIAHDSTSMPCEWNNAYLDGETMEGFGIISNINSVSASIYHTSGWMESTGNTFSSHSISDSWTLDPPEPIYPMYGGAAIRRVVWTNDETNPTITYSYPKSPDSTSQTIKACISFTGGTDDIAYREVSKTETTYTFDLTSDDRTKLQSLLSQGKTANLTFRMWTVETFPDGSRNEKTNDYNFTLTFVNYTPVVTVSDIYDTNPDTVAITGGYTSDGYPIIVRYMSDVHYKMNVQLRKGASDVIGCYVENGGRRGGEGLLEGIYNKPTSNTFYFSATDNRGNTGTTTYSFDGAYIDYVKLTANVSATPMNGNGDLSFTVSGKYFNKSFNANTNNTLSLKYAVYLKGQPAPIPVDLGVIDADIDGTDYTYTVPLSGLDYTKQYVIDVIVSDKLTSDTASTTVIARPVYYWNNDEFVINVPLTLEGDLTINGQSLLSILRNGGLI